VIKKYLGVIAILSFNFFAIHNVALAHHSFAAIWDETRELEITGELSVVRWVNPHSFFMVSVTDASGNEETYRFENFPPAMLSSLGLSRKTMTDQIGNQVRVLYNPARDGTRTIGYGRVFDFLDGPTIVFTGDGSGGGSGEPSLGVGVLPE